jgi:hypothetical protein
MFVIVSPPSGGGETSEAAEGVTATRYNSVHRHAYAMLQHSI